MKHSHNDLPVEYLARGMSGKSLAPRFALTAVGEIGPWASLGIKEIGFDKTQSSNPFEHLYAGVKNWAAFSNQQPTDRAERVKNIVSAPEALTLDRTQSSLLKRCMEHEDSCHFFTSEAKGWRWVKWLHAEGRLTPIFDSSRQELTSPERDLAHWLAEELLAQISEEGLLLVEKHGGTIGRDLWSALAWHLSYDKVDWTSPVIQKWVILLVETCPCGNY